MSDLLSGLSAKVTHRQELNKFVSELKDQKNADVVRAINKLDKMLNSDKFQYIDRSLIEQAEELTTAPTQQKLDLKDYKKQVSAFIDSIFANEHLVNSNRSIVKLAGSLNDTSVNSFQLWKKKCLEYQHKLREICKILVSFELQERERRIKESLDEIERRTTLHFDVEDKSKTDVYDEAMFLGPETRTPPSNLKKRSKKYVLSKFKKAFTPKKNEEKERRGYRTGRHRMMSERIPPLLDNKSSSIRVKRSRSYTNKISLPSTLKSNSTSFSSDSGQEAVSPAPLMRLKDSSDSLITEEYDISTKFEGKTKKFKSALENKSDIDSVTSGTGNRPTDSGYDSKSDADSFMGLGEPSPRPSSRLKINIETPTYVKTFEERKAMQHLSVASKQAERLSETQSDESTHDSYFNETEHSSFPPESIITKSQSLNIQQTISQLREEEDEDTEKSGEETAMESSKPKNILKRSIIGCNAEGIMAGIMRIVDDLKEYESEVTLDELEICGCELEKSHLERLRDLNIPDFKISKFVIKHTTNIKYLIRLCCEVFDKYQASILDLECDDLKNDDIEDLQKHLRENKTLKELNVSSNRNISQFGYELIGCIVKEHGIVNLKVADCNITSEGLTALFSAIGPSKLEELDLSCSKKLKPYDFESIGKFVASNGVKRLKMSGCQLTEEAIWQICKQNHPLDELDVSYNPTMESDAYKTLGLAAKTCQIKKLGLAGCELNEEALATLRESIDGHTMKEMNAGDNTSIASGITEVGKIALGCKLEDVDISDCMLVYDELKNFKNELYPERGKSHEKLKRLSLGDYGRQLGQEYISEVCELLPQIEERLNLKFGKLRKQYRNMLQEKLNQLGENGLQLYLNDEQMTTFTGKGMGSNID